jgi:hypothetical protein
MSDQLYSTLGLLIHVSLYDLQFKQWLAQKETLPHYMSNYGMFDRRNVDHQCLPKAQRSHKKSRRYR